MSSFIVGRIPHKRASHNQTRTYICNVYTYMHTYTHIHSFIHTYTHFIHSSYIHTAKIRNTTTQTRARLMPNRFLRGTDAAMVVSISIWEARRKDIHIEPPYFTFKTMGTDTHAAPFSHPHTAHHRDTLHIFIKSGGEAEVKSLHTHCTDPKSKRQLL